jgi:hypothetical protein
MAAISTNIHTYPHVPTRIHFRVVDNLAAGRQTDRQTETDRQTDGQRDRERDREREREREREQPERCNIFTFLLCTGLLRTNLGYFWNLEILWFFFFFFFFLLLFFFFFFLSQRDTHT